MYLERCQKILCKKPWHLVFVGVLLCIAFSWFGFEDSEWHPKALLSCKPRNSSPYHLNQSNKATFSCDRPNYLNFSKDVILPRMLYEKPEALRPPRTDVLMMTHWLAPIIWDGTYNIDILNAQFKPRDVRIGLLIFAIKKYTVFLPTFIETAEKYFMVGYKVNYYVFTDRASNIPNITVGKGRQFVVLEASGYKRWQEIVLRRMQVIRDYTSQRFVNEVDYLVSADIDMKFKDDVGVESLSELFGTLHPGYYGVARHGFTYERRPQSQAYIPADEGDFYYAAGYYGGTVEEMYKLTDYCHTGIMKDKENNIEAVWHEESHLNKYFIYHKPTKILSPEYLWDERMGIPGILKRRRFVAVPKNHNEIRNKRSVI
ncbi:histo-blood group ABO system transferase-like isoform 2-T2 [Rhinophrynus dorsalis]